MRRATRRTNLRVGDRVWVPVPYFHYAPAKVIEDRGRIGVGGRQLVRVEVYLDPPYLTEVPAEDTRRRSARSHRPRVAPRAS